jgi:hypothetical protein
MTIHMLGVEYPDLRAALHRLSTQPSVRARLTVPGIAGGVPIHGSRLARALRVLPRQWTASLDTADDDTLRLVLAWDSPARRGCLRLRALGAIQLGEIASATLDTCDRYETLDILPQLSRSEIAAAKRVLGCEYTLGYRLTGRALSDALIAYGWRHYTDAPIT